MAALKGNVSWQLGAKGYHKVTLHNKFHTEFPGRDKVAASAWGEAAGDWARGGLYIGFLGGRVGIGRLSSSGIGGGI